MNKNLGIVVKGRFVEQHGTGTPYLAEALKGGSESNVSSTGGSRSIQEIWAAGREFARQCEIEGLANRAYGRGRF